MLIWISEITYQLDCTLGYYSTPILGHPKYSTKVPTPCHLGSGRNLRPHQQFHQGNYLQYCRDTNNSINRSWRMEWDIVVSKLNLLMNFETRKWDLVQDKYILPNNAPIYYWSVKIHVYYCFVNIWKFQSLNFLLLQTSLEIKKFGIKN